MSIEESIQQIETLIEAWQLDEADLNQTDINAMQVLLKEKQELEKQLEERTKMYQNAYDYSQKMEGKAIILETQQKELKKQLEDKEDYINKLQATKDKLDKWDYENTMQQKEFIKWLENGIEKVKNTEFLDERIQRAGLIAYNRCLRKYKKITQTE
jgi:hypothetical protein